MPKSFLLALILALLPAVGSGQELSPSDSKIVEAARSRYYDLGAAGFMSLSCSIKFDFSTVPMLSKAGDDPTRKLVEATQFSLVIDEKGNPTVQHHYPGGSVESTDQNANLVIQLLTSLVNGLFNTWATKGLRGPIPPFDSEIESIAATDHGFTMILRVPGGPVRVLMDKAYLVTEIISIGDSIDEHPKFLPGPDGLIYSGNEATDRTDAKNPVSVRYDLQSSVVDGLTVPSSARLQVNENVDLKFSLTGCTVKKGMVIHLAPPAASVKR